MFCPFRRQHIQQHPNILCRPSITKHIQRILLTRLDKVSLPHKPRKEGWVGTSKRIYIHPYRPPCTAFRNFFQKSSLWSSRQDDRLTFQYPRSQSNKSRVWALRRYRDRGSCARCGGRRGILSLSTRGIGNEISCFSCQSQWISTREGYVVREELF